MRTLHADTLTLEPQAVAHAGKVFAVLSDPAIYTYENAPPTSVEWLRTRFEKLESRQSMDGSEQWLNWVIRLPTTELVGAAYLIYLGVTLLRTRNAELVVGASSRGSLARLFLDGAFSNISNPKIAVFYFAFLPQFVLPGAAHPTLSVFALGLTFAGLTLLDSGSILSKGLYLNPQRRRVARNPSA